MMKDEDICSAGEVQQQDGAADGLKLKQDQETEHLRIVLVGKTGVGKSATGNTILGREAFESKLSTSSITSECKKDTGEFEGQKLAVIDTPGLFDTMKTQQEVKRELARSISLACPGPHVILVVLQPNRFTKEEQETVKLIQKIFGEQAARYTMALFTHGDDLKEERVDIKKLISENSGLSNFIEQCHGGFHVFNNREKDPAQVRELLGKINKMVQINGGKCYTTEMFEEAEKAIRDREKHILRENPNMQPKQARRQAERLVGEILAGCAAGAAIGSVFGPVGTVLGFSLGSAVGAITAGVDYCITQ